VGDPVERIFVW